MDELRVNARKVRENRAAAFLKKCLRPEGGKEVTTRLPEVMLMMNTTTVHMASRRPPSCINQKSKTRVHIRRKNKKKKHTHTHKMAFCFGLMGA